jgi:Restriction endonuclease
MTTEEEYKARVKAYNWKELDDLWDRIISRETDDQWATGKALEYFVVRAFELSGVHIVYPYRVVLNNEEIEQIDGVVYSNNLTCLIECKDTSKEVNVEPIAKLRNQLFRRPAVVIGSIFSFKGFTAPAVVLSQFLAPQTILLWNSDMIKFSLDQRDFASALLKKYRYYVEYGIVDYDLTSES